MHTNILDVFNNFQTQEQAIAYLEDVRWRGRPTCPYCKGTKVGVHSSNDRKMSRWQCQECHRPFAVTVGTIFHGTHIPLRDWFLCIAVMLNAKKSASAYQIARDLGIRRATVWSMMHRVRIAMANDPEQAELMYGIVADETYIGARRKRGAKRGRAGKDSHKTPVIGVMERGGRVVARPAKPEELGTKGLSKFIEKHVEKAGTLRVTDEWSGYNRVKEMMLHATVNHAAEYGNGILHTNSIEGFWGLVKRAWYGSHHHYSKKYMSLYIAEACYKFNARLGGRGLGDSVALFASTSK